MLLLKRVIDIIDQILSELTYIQARRSFAYQMIKRTHDEGCDRPDAIHYCFQCGKPFPIKSAIYCELCDWWRAPCGHCGCTLPPRELKAAEIAYMEICGSCTLTPKKKRRKK